MGTVGQGGAVAISADGNTAIIGAGRDGSDSGAAWVFTRSGDAWSQQGSKLLPTDAAAGPIFGASVAVSADGNMALIGGHGDNHYAGAAWVFTRSGGNWSQQGSKLLPSDPASPPMFGGSVALSSDGTTALIGGPYENQCDGATWVFTRTDGVWTQQSKLLANNLTNTSHACWFMGQGNSVALAGDGNTAVVGGPDDSCVYPSECVGATWVYRRANGVWTQQDKLVGAGATKEDGSAGGMAEQGAAVAISRDGSTLVIGGPLDNGESDTQYGATWAYALPHFVFAVPATQTAGASFSFTVSVQDANGMLLPAYAGMVHFTSTDPGAMLPADATLINGLGSFSATLNAAGLQTITFTDTANSGIFGSVSVSVAANATAAARRK
jgi:hypothetical protein